MILTHLYFFFFSGAETGTPTPTPTVTAVGHGRRRRRVIIDDVIYEGTDEQIEAKLWELLQKQQRAEPKKQQKAKKRQKKPVQLTRSEPTVRPIYLPRFKQLQAEYSRHEDQFMLAMLRRVMERYLEDEEEELILLAS